MHAWDEAWAFYAGSLEGSAGNSDGRMLYRLAEKRCKNFGTCQGGIADVNKQILNIFISGKTSLAEGRLGELKILILHRLSFVGQVFDFVFCWPDV